MSILARDKVPPKTVKANINIPHCRGIPTKLPNQSHSRVVSKRLCKQKGEERRRGGGGGKKVKEKERKTGGAGERREKKGGENVRRLSNDRQLLPPFRAKVQRSEVKARRKNCHEWANRPRASSAHVYFTVYSPRVSKRIHVYLHGERSGNLWMILCIAVASYGSHRVIVTFWKPDTGRDPFCSSPFHGLHDVATGVPFSSTTPRFHLGCFRTFWAAVTSKILYIYVYIATVIDGWYLQQRCERIIYSWRFRKFARFQLFKNAWNEQTKGTSWPKVKWICPSRRI